VEIGSDLRNDSRVARYVVRTVSSLSRQMFFADDDGCAGLLR